MVCVWYKGVAKQGTLTSRRVVHACIHVHVTPLAAWFAYVQL